MSDFSAKDAFKLGFLSRCAEEGLTGSMLQQRLKMAQEKSALWPALLGIGAAGLGAAALGNSLTDGGKSLLGGTAQTLGSLGALGLAGGAGVGYGLAKATSPDITDDDIRAQEIAQTYRVYADRARRKKRVKKQYRG